MGIDLSHRHGRTLETNLNIFWNILLYQKWSQLYSIKTESIEQ